MNNRRVFELVSDKSGVHGVEWSDLSYKDISNQPRVRSFTFADEVVYTFTKDNEMTTYEENQFVRKLRGGGLTCVMVDLVSASNPISQRQSAMSKKGKK